MTNTIEAAAGLPDHIWINIVLMILIAAAVFTFAVITLKDQ